MIKGWNIRFHFFFSFLFLRVEKESGGFRQIYFLCSGFKFLIEKWFSEMKKMNLVNNLFEQKVIEIKHKILLSVPDTRWYSFGNWTQKRLTSTQTQQQQKMKRTEKLIKRELDTNSKIWNSEHWTKWKMEITTYMKLRTTKWRLPTIEQSEQIDGNIMFNVQIMNVKYH